MFSRYALFSEPSEITQAFGVKVNRIKEATQQYNIGHGKRVPLIISGHARDTTLVDGDWGGIPGAPASVLLSDLQTKMPEARKQLSRHRCIIPLNGFYAWKVLSESLRLPFFFRMLDAPLFGVAGIYTITEDNNGEAHYGFTAIEVPANELLEPLAESMPAIMPFDDVDTWLNPLQSDVSVVTAMLKPCKTSYMASFRVGDGINSTEAEGKDLINPLV